MGKKEKLEIKNLEHISSEDGENINAKRIGVYGYDAVNSQWRRIAVDDQGRVKTTT
jgi:hypothetical protein